MRVMVLGSCFVGRSIVEQCLGRSLQVTVVNRGTKAMPGVRQLVCDRDNGVQLERTRASAPFDVLVDTCCYCYNERQATLVARAMAGRGAHCLCQRKPDGGDRAGHAPDNDPRRVPERGSYRIERCATTCTRCIQGRE